MALTADEKLKRKKQRMVDAFRPYTIGTCKNKVAAIYQKKVRAVAAALSPGYATAIVNGLVGSIWRELGQCVCVTCGKVGPWKGEYYGGGKFDTGHFVGGRGASIIFESSCTHPQCKHCNRDLDGNLSNYRVYMRYVYGADEIERLERLRNVTIQWTREELVDLKIMYMEQLRVAEAIIKHGQAADALIKLGR